MRKVLVISVKRYSGLGYVNRTRLGLPFLFLKRKRASLQEF